MTLFEAIDVYRRLVSAHTRSQMQYKVSFILVALGGFAANLTEFAALYVLLGRIPHLAGWSLGEVALLYGMSAVSFALAEMVAAGFDDFQVRIVQGTFDRVLTRPRGAFFQTLAEDLALRRLGRACQGVVVLLIAQRHLAVEWTADKLLVLALGIAGGLAIFFAIFVLGAAFCFWTVQGKEATHIFTYGGTTLASYPLDIFDGWVRRFVTFVLPLAFVNYYPAVYLLGRPDPLGFPRWVGLLSPLVAAACGLLAWWGWSAGVRHYQSTGS
jgi:ABC-2 type transport system permease protein